jgi:hypothetical protein
MKVEKHIEAVLALGAPDLAMQTEKIALILALIRAKAGERRR